MREVSRVDVRVIAYPVDGAWVVECSEHGFLLLATNDTVDDALIAHMHDSHGARVPA